MRFEIIASEEVIL